MTACFLLIYCFISAKAQYSNESEANVLYNRERVGIININSSGIGASFRQSKIKDAFKATFFEINFSTYWDIKQEKIIWADAVGAKAFTYAKLNEVFFLRGGYGNIYKITRKPSWGGVELQLAYSFGGSICFAMPIYLYIQDQNGDVGYSTLEKYDPEKHNLENIFGGGPYFKGITDIKVYPGIYGNVGFYFEYGQYNSVVKALEIGGLVNIFPIGVPVMAYNDPKNIFFSFYINIIFGRRYNK
ncbi:hypothetical protein LJC25_03120 [Bacteroidales bacterium OttesenSCG-928-K03]|nr:hypothetical protein [Odoribacter sp. OttesenSCG-928-L07]MDL2238647.1 hypothetical protein [Bacteroidales bacterium OttesenSCG-928-L14]MDL2240282.1 hypothetical protein [Bacteroidales bacterium OttesenSCG-928-K22]MDL2242701.1 hypothetical protein [Bacteroidales bacterium OttesenSCG-928-K03]